MKAAGPKGRHHKGYCAFCHGCATLGLQVFLQYLLWGYTYVCFCKYRNRTYLQPPGYDSHGSSEFLTAMVARSLGESQVRTLLLLPFHRAQHYQEHTLPRPKQGPDYARLRAIVGPHFGLVGIRLVVVSACMIYGLYRQHRALYRDYNQVLQSAKRF